MRIPGGKVTYATTSKLRDLTQSMPPDSPFPSERVLSEQLGVSRTTIRSALRALEGEGRLLRRGRTGRYTRGVESISGSPAPTREEREARLIYESAVIKDLASNIDPIRHPELIKYLNHHLAIIQDIPKTEQGQRELTVENASFHKQLASFHSNDRVTAMLYLAIDEMSTNEFRYIDKEVITLQHKLMVQAILLGEPQLADNSVRLNLSYELDLW